VRASVRYITAAAPVPSTYSNSVKRRQRRTRRRPRRPDLPRQPRETRRGRAQVLHLHHEPRPGHHQHPDSVPIHRCDRGRSGAVHPFGRAKTGSEPVADQSSAEKSLPLDDCRRAASSQPGLPCRHPATPSPHGRALLRTAPAGCERRLGVRGDRAARRRPAVRDGSGVAPAVLDGPHRHIHGQVADHRQAAAGPPSAVACAARRRRHRPGRPFAAPPRAGRARQTPA
jgi:hypothetical protein